MNQNHVESKCKEMNYVFKGFRPPDKNAYLKIIRAPPTNVGEALLYSACLSVVTLTQSFFIGFLTNFIYGLLPSISHSSSNTGFVQQLITKMADKMAATYQYPLSWSL